MCIRDRPQNSGKDPAKVQAEQWKEALCKFYCRIQVKQDLQFLRKGFEKVEQRGCPGTYCNPEIDFMVMVKMFSEQSQQDQGNGRRINEHQHRHRIPDDGGKSNV